MVKQDAVAGVHAIGFAVVDDDPVRIHFRHGVGAAWVKGRGFFLRNFLHQTIQLGCAGLVEAGFLLQAQDANGLEQAQGANAVDVGSVFRTFKAHSHMALGAEVVDFVGLRFLHDAYEVAGVAQVAVVQLEIGVLDMRILVNVVHTLRVKRAGATFDAMNDVPLFQQKLGKVRTVLAGDTRDEGHFLLFWLGHSLLTKSW